MSTFSRVSGFTEYAHRYFDFLSKRFGFRRTVGSPSHTRYATDSLYFDLTADPRDGTGVEFGRLAQPGIEPHEPCERICLGTLLGAIQTQFGNYKQWARPPEQEIEALSLGLREHADALIAADPELYRRLRELRFWHVGDWTRSWGKTIRMSPEVMAQNAFWFPVSFAYSNQLGSPRSKEGQAFYRSFLSGERFEWVYYRDRQIVVISV